MLAAGAWLLSELSSQQSKGGSDHRSDWNWNRCMVDLPEYLSPETELIAAESEEKIMQFIQTLDTDTKTAFTLREIDGRTYDEIAKILKCPIGTVRSRIFRARQLILEFINQENIING